MLTLYQPCMKSTFYQKNTGLLPYLPQGYVETGEKVHQITTQSPTFTVAWHPKKHLLAYACDDKVGIN